MTRPTSTSLALRSLLKLDVEEPGGGGGGVGVRVLVRQLPLRALEELEVVVLPIILVVVERYSEE